jgi:peptide/nickel transport system permease protein
VSRYILRRLIQSVFTILGVMILTFLLFNVIAGDIAAQHTNPKAGPEQRYNFLRKHDLHLPVLFNLRRFILLTDTTSGDGRFTVVDGGRSNVASALALEPLDKDAKTIDALRSRGYFLMTRDDPLEAIVDGWDLFEPPRKTPASTGTGLVFELRDGSNVTIDIEGVRTAGDLIDRINDAPGNQGRLHATIGSISAGRFFHSQFFVHMRDTLTFQSTSFRYKQTLWQIVREKAPYSLSLTVPALALGWFSAMIVSCLVAYYRGTWLDNAGVFIAVLGMCIPFLAYMILGQWVMFQIAPAHAFGLHVRANIYVPIAIAVVAGLGTSVRFYRTVILNEINQEYVRTARAKGVSLPTILFKHVLRNCMLPILTNLVMAIPFLILGSLLLEKFFGVPGLGDLMVSSITDRDVPVITTLTFLTAVVYVLGLLLTDILYAVFDPRIRLR